MNKIKELRKEKNITVAELAKELGISQSMLTNYEMETERREMNLYGKNYHRYST